MPSRPGVYPAVGDGLHEQGKDVFRAGDVGGEAALVAEAGGVALVVQELLQRGVGLRPGADGLGDGWGAERGDHELLEVQAVRGVHAAVDDVEVRGR